MTFEEQVSLLAGQATKIGVYQKVDGPFAGLIHPDSCAGQVGPGTYVCTDSDVVLFSEPAELLQRLYADANPVDRKTFVTTLTKVLNATNARVVARTLAAVGHLGSIEQMTATGPVSEELWRGLIHSLRYESGLFAEADLGTVEHQAAKLRARVYAAAIEQYQKSKKANEAFPYPIVGGGIGSPLSSHHVVLPIDKVLNELRSVVARVRYLRLADAIRQRQNPAIDIDRQTLLSRLESMGFSEDLSTASTDIEHRAAIAVTDVDVKAVMDLLRAFHEGFVKEACSKVATKVGVAAPASTSSHYAPYADYLHKHNFLGVEEWELLGKLYRFLSNQGAHQLSSKSEQLRVAHATVIEWCMLIAGRINLFLMPASP